MLFECVVDGRLVIFEVKRKKGKKVSTFYLQGILSFQVEGQFNFCFKSTLFIAFSGQRRLLGAISFEVVSIFFASIPLYISTYPISLDSQLVDD